MTQRDNEGDTLGPESIDALTFDVFGTLVDWRSGVFDAGRELHGRTGQGTDWARLADAWRGGYEPAMEPVRSGRRPWEPIDVLHGEILDRLLAERGLGFHADDRRWFIHAWHRLPAWPDVRIGLERLRSRFTVCALSNGNVSLLEDLATYNALGFDHILSAEHARTYKPLPAVYTTAASRLNLPPERILMVAAHDDDLRGARAVGFRTAFLPRPTEWGPNGSAEVPAEPHDLTVADCAALADALEA